MILEDTSCGFDLLRSAAQVIINMLAVAYSAGNIHSFASSFGSVCKRHFAQEAVWLPSE